MPGSQEIISSLINPRIKLENFNSDQSACRLSSLIRGLGQEIFLWSWGIST